MKRLFLLLIPTLIFTTFGFAKDDIPGEQIFVAQQQNIMPVDDLAVDCAWAPQVFVLPAGGFKSDLYSVQSKKTNGVLLNGDIKKVGQMLGCYDAGAPNTERGIVPTFDIGQAWLLNFNGQDYIVTGMNRLRTTPGVDVILGVPGEFLGVAIGTVFTPESIMMNPPKPVGSFSLNYIANAIGNDVVGAGGIMTLRLYNQ